LRTFEGLEELTHRIHPHADCAATLTIWVTGLIHGSSAPEVTTATRAPPTKSAAAPRNAHSRGEDAAGAVAGRAARRNTPRGRSPASKYLIARSTMSRSMCFFSSA